MTTLRMVRNAPIERWIIGHAEPFAPLYDVEEVDAGGFPARVIAIGVNAETARKIIDKLRIAA